MAFNQKLRKRNSITDGNSRNKKRKTNTKYTKDKNMFRQISQWYLFHIRLANIMGTDTKKIHNFVVCLTCTFWLTKNTALLCFALRSLKRFCFTHQPNQHTKCVVSARWNNRIFRLIELSKSFQYNVITASNRTQLGLFPWRFTWTWEILHFFCEINDWPFDAFF